ncbi:MAG: NAD(P)/FAD-dependent oxidoreductase [Saprospiraceae bacterium]|nr:NAD(P)/FAD-dependent oxidoreductase [Saprospiraceae bacterium]
MEKTDIVIIGAGPCGLFTVFEAGLLKLKCHLIDYLPSPGGQLAEIYPKKPIYDIPGHPVILAKDLIANLMEQISVFNPKFTLGERVDHLLKREDGIFEIKTSLGSEIEAPVIIIAAGLGCFEPRKPEIENISEYENKGVHYIIKDPELFRNKNVVIAGGGDSALDWCIFLAEITEKLTLIHRRSEFRAAPESISKLSELVNQNKVHLHLNAEVTKLHGNVALQSLTIKNEQEEWDVICDQFLPLFGLSPKLGPIAEWGLNVDKNAILVNSIDYSTNVPGIFAVGDINSYEGKLKLILCGFHEATLAVQSAYKIIHKGQKPSFKYTTVTGINKF